MIPIVAALMEAGLGMLGNAVLAKGKEVVEDKLGIKLPDGDKPLDPAQVVELKKAEMAHEEWLIDAGIRRQQQEIDAEKVAQENVTERWTADMSSDSWLSKNIRPMSLIYLTVAFTLLMLLDGYTDFNPEPAYVSLLGELLKVAFGAYFVGRTVVQGIEMYGKANGGGK